ncbi:multidrug efflux RND transporter permease subunit [Rubellicoccus peritrichatus]|uniref:Multidrug efflux RND transporter permease subunit n=1 Tax=Rubellicoccus peritrichatus TaxID=3080537 RepID=A0AAQ3QT91_9BACT|nr:multidrug efflux RND transporter permease subunit [Puniceicoccus sp. CR14]WOO43448.1 multidrug efflux RND transporter permease subunit [Puniceicoccus sp. CR14]
MFSHFFIRRPVFAAVISIVTVIIGLFALITLPVDRYPDIAPPTITVTASYPGADSQTVADTVATPIEQSVNGVEDMIYMSSISANDGSMSLTVTFETGTDVDMANVLTQNRVSKSTSSLPQEVQRLGVTVDKKSTSANVYVAFYSPDGSYNDLFVSNYLDLQIKDEIARVPGVGNVQTFGAGKYSMRVWLDPQVMKARGVTVTEVTNAIQEQNVQVAAGTVGVPPAPPNQAFQYTVNVDGRLVDAEQFGDIIIRTADGNGGGVLRIRDIGRVELGAESYLTSSRFNGKPSAIMAAYQIPGANAIEVTDGIIAKLEELSKSFPEGLDYKVVYDNTLIIKSSIKEVVKTLFEALILVILTVFIFLQNFRATIIPAITIPVSLTGTFAAMAVVGFSINQLTLFGMVLVIGIVVDDAIMVVENCSRHIEEGKSPKDAAFKAMSEVSGPVIATTLVLLAVFVPAAFLSGITGILFKQFAVTISIATIFSSINALTLSPALCSILLRKQPEKVNFFFRGFNFGMDKMVKGYSGTVKLALRKCVIGLVLFLGLVFLSGWGFVQLPTGFVPQEDEGYCIVAIQLPDGAALDRTRDIADQVGEIVGQTPGVANYIAVSGFSLLDGAAASNTAFAIAVFEPWDDRGPEEHQSAIIQNLNRQFYAIQKAQSFAFPVPSLPGVGLSGGFTMMIQDRGGVGLQTLQEVSQQYISDGNSQSALTGMYTTFRANVPQLFLDIDREQVKNRNLSLDSIWDALQVYLGSSYVNDFTLFNRVFKVYAQAEQEFRAEPKDIRALNIQAPNGEMVPLGGLLDIDEIVGPQTITRYNLYPSVKIMGNATPGHSSGDAMEVLANMADRTLPTTMGYDWTDLSYQQASASGSTTIIFALAIVLVYLVMAAQYESWSLPISVVLAVPTALAGAVAANMIRGYDNNVYTQIGIVLLIGLSTKSAIMIVEFAKVQRESGMSPFDAALSAAKLRFRPVLMTALSFILGVLPLLIATGAGGESQRAIGTSVFGGMIVATVVSVIIVPMLYFIVQTLTEKVTGKKVPINKEAKG